jgi:hypothetical protein
MRIEFDIYEGMLLVDLIESDMTGEVVVAHGELSIEALFEEMARIKEDRRVEAAREASLAGEIRAGRKRPRLPSVHRQSA